MLPFFSCVAFISRPTPLASAEFSSSSVSSVICLRDCCALRRMVAMEAVMKMDFSGARVGAMGAGGEC